MAEPIVPVRTVATVQKTDIHPPIETEAEMHPPVIAFSTAAGAAVTGTNTANGPGVIGKSTHGDGVQGESAGANMSGVSGFHTAGGNGVYGRSTGNAGFFQGNVQINGSLNVTGDIYLPGADLAEQFEAAPGAELLPGMLVVVDENGALQASTRPYDRALAGVVAGAGSHRPGVILDSNPSDLPRAKVSLAGKAFCYADATYGPIAIGDPLTSSATPGCAMKATDQTMAFGAVVGKALRPLATGKELIPILVTLQ
jgi:hypothetical protein